MDHKELPLVFTRNNARFAKGHPIEKLKGEAIVINPDLSKVKGVKPHYWKLVKGEVLPMDQFERECRDRDIAKNGCDNDIFRHDAAEAPAYVAKFNTLPWVLALIIWGLIIFGMKVLGE